jgi:esterase/lipase superfamily enzyme
MSGAFDMDSFLGGYYDQDVLLQPADCTLFQAAVGSMVSGSVSAKHVHVLATGVHDQCWDQNERMAGVMRDERHSGKGWMCGEITRGHDWPWWQRMVQSLPLNASHDLTVRRTL